MKEFVSFPNLGWELPISKVLVEFDLFGVTFSIRWYGVLIAIGFLLAMIYALKRANFFDVDPDRLIDVVLVSAIFAFLGARLYFIIFYDGFSTLWEDPLKIFRVWEGGLAIYGGIIFAFITALWMCRVRKVNTLALFDLASLGFLIGQGIGRWGNFFNQEAFGGNTNLPWGMSGSDIMMGISGSGYDTSLPVHPTFLYESLWCLLGFLLLHFVSKKAYKFKGQIFSLYIVWYGFGRFMIEGLRTDSLMLGTMRVSQLVAILSVLGGILLFFVFRSRARSLPADLFAESTLQIEETTAEAAGEGEENVTLEETENVNSESDESTADERVGTILETLPESEEEPAEDTAVNDEQPQEEK